MTTVVQKGSGATRDALIAFKIPGSIVAAAAPDAVVIEETGPSLQNWYEHGSPSRGMAMYDALVGLAVAAAAEDGAKVGRVFLLGFSEGGEAIRTHLIEGANPSGVIAVDGLYTPLNDSGPRTRVWMDYVSRAKSCDRIMVASHASLPATLGRSPQATLALATGWKMPESDTVTRNGGGGWDWRCCGGWCREAALNRFHHGKCSGLNGSTRRKEEKTKK